VNATHKHAISEYVAQANHNSAFATDIRKHQGKYLDWAATCLFYAAVHYVNAYFVKSQMAIPRRHSSPDPKNPGRMNIVQQDPSLKIIYAPYRHLDDESRDARYELKVVSEADYDKFLLPQLEKIRKCITPNFVNDGLNEYRLGCGPADITFAEGAQTELMRLGEGDSISIQGALRVETHAKAGEKRVVAKLRRAA
jgi:hypothetical protein